MSNCKSCECGCVLISLECLYDFTPLENSTMIERKKSVFESANDFLIEDLLGEKCFERLCEATEQEEEDKWTKLLKNRNFKKLVAWSIYMEWLKQYGGGRASAVGQVAYKDADDNSSNISASSLEKMIARFEGVRDSYYYRVKEYLEKNDFGECSDECGGCGCCQSECCCEDEDIGFDHTYTIL